MSKKELEDANIFIFGDQLTGKKSLIRVINKDVISRNVEESKRYLNLDDTAPKYGMIDYTYLNITKLSEKDLESIGKMGVSMNYKIINGAVSYGADTILEEINFEIKDKDKIAIVGRNGSGKTTLLKTLIDNDMLEQGVGESKFGGFEV